MSRYHKTSPLTKKKKTSMLEEIILVGSNSHMRDCLTFVIVVEHWGASIGSLNSASEFYDMEDFLHGQWLRAENSSDRRWEKWKQQIKRDHISFLMTTLVSSKWQQTGRTKILDCSYTKDSLEGGNGEIV